MDYKQTEVIGSAWHRFSRIVIENPRPGIPTVTCIEQEVIALTSGEVIRDVGNLSFIFDPSGTFEILNPLDNTPTGQMASGSDVYALVYSLVMAEAKARDLRLNPPAPEPEPEPTPDPEPTE